MDELVLSIGALLSAAIGVGVTGFEGRRAARRARKKRASLQVEHHADLPTIWTSLVVNEADVDEPSRAVVRGALGRQSDVVLKIVSIDSQSPRESFGLFREAFVLNWLAGVHAPRPLGIASSDDGRSMALVMEAARGDGLNIAVRKSEPPTVSDVYSLVDSLCEAVSGIHALGFVHGDLKPSNIVAEWERDSPDRWSIRIRSKITLVDFESASLLAEAESMPASPLNNVRGTHGFTAPERFYRFDSHPSVDVYSCGILASYLLTLAPRRPGTAVRDRIEIPGWRDLINRCTGDPEFRPQTVSEFRANWRRAFEDTPSGARQNLVRWPKRSSERLTAIGRLRVFDSIVASEFDDQVNRTARVDESADLSGLTTREREIFERWLDRDVGWGEVGPILRKIEQRYFDQFVERDPDLKSLLLGGSDDADDD